MPSASHKPRRWRNDLLPRTPRAALLGKIIAVLELPSKVLDHRVHDLGFLCALSPFGLELLLCVSLSVGWGPTNNTLLLLLPVVPS